MGRKRKGLNSKENMLSDKELSILADEVWAKFEDSKPMITETRKGELRVLGYYIEKKPYCEYGIQIGKYKDFIQLPKRLDVREFIRKKILPEVLKEQLKFDKDFQMNYNTINQKHNSV